mmetsp:Transcript_26948/g.39922  ORF Transcript_26948/g.39922 Transcript_26948/m.39922 type:complete len:204 (-) Transcript_26948:867-1478(-)
MSELPFFTGIISRGILFRTTGAAETTPGLGAVAEIDATLSSTPCVEFCVPAAVPLVVSSLLIEASDTLSSGLESLAMEEWDTLESETVLTKESGFPVEIAFIVAGWGWSGTLIPSLKPIRKNSPLFKCEVECPACSSIARCSPLYKRLLSRLTRTTFFHVSVTHPTAELFRYSRRVQLVVSSGSKAITQLLSCCNRDFISMPS